MQIIFRLLCTCAIDNLYFFFLENQFQFQTSAWHLRERERETPTKTDWIVIFGSRNLWKELRNRCAECVCFVLGFTYIIYIIYVRQHVPHLYSLPVRQLDMSLMRVIARWTHLKHVDIISVDSYHLTVWHTIKKKKILRGFSRAVSIEMGELGIRFIDSLFPWHILGNFWRNRLRWKL